MVAATDRVDELCQLLNDLTPEEAMQFVECCDAHMKQRTTRYVFLFVSQAMAAMTSWQTSGKRRLRALEMLSVLDKYPSQWDSQLNRARAILDNGDANYWEFDEAGSLLKEVLLESHLLVTRNLPEQP
ncbi:MAG: hypothetical protein IT422_03075 [Pirellulaceae bacterium]|nr:hypothetical protein [Pirellulaceae bacterium]